mgnify:CR=1 FL=1
MKFCKVCGKPEVKAHGLCVKHYNQLLKYGKTMDNNPRTVWDKNEIRVLNNYVEIDTYDQFGNVLVTYKIDIEDVPLLSNSKWRTVFKGKSFGYEKPVAGEVVFSTGMVGYTESLSDPSYSGQILTLTYPLIGNYGVPKDEIIDGISTFYESEKIQASALIISDFSFEYSHWNAGKSLSDWLKENEVPGIFGVDTRELTKLVREKGTMRGKLVFPEGDDIEFINPDDENQVAKVSCKEVITYGSGKHRVLLVDCGVKHNIIRCLLKRDTTIIRVPWDYDFNHIEFDGLFISNGPGDPEYAQDTVQIGRASCRERVSSPV